MQNTLFTFFNKHLNGKPYSKRFTNISSLILITTQWGIHYYYEPFADTKAQWNNLVDNMSTCL